MRSFRLIMWVVVLGIIASRGFCKVPESAFDKDPWPMVKEGPLKVFILTGQSNMQGHASLRTLENLIYNPQTAAEYEHWKDREGRWTERRDVWNGQLTDSDTAASDRASVRMK